MHTQACFAVAAKIVDAQGMTVSELSVISNDIFSAPKVRDMEIAVLRSLDGDLSATVSYTLSFFFLLSFAYRICVFARKRHENCGFAQS
jgi:hypothetical protein